MDRSFFSFPFLRLAVCPPSVYDKSKVLSYYHRLLLLSPSQKPYSEPCTILWTLVQKVCTLGLQHRQWQEQQQQQ